MVGCSVMARHGFTFSNAAIMTTSAAKLKLDLDEAQRDWLKTMGALLDVRVGGEVVTPASVANSITAKPSPSQPAAPVAPSQPAAPAQPDTKPRTVVVTVTDKMTKLVVPNADVKIGDQAGKTNDKGIATLTLPPGAYQFSVTANTYAQASGTAEVTANPQTTLSVVLKPTRTVLTLTASPAKESHLEQDIVFTATIDVGNPQKAPLGVVEFVATYYRKRISLAKVEVKDWKASYTWYLQPVGDCLFDATFTPNPQSTGFQECISNLLRYTVGARTPQQTDDTRKEYEQAYRETLPVINQGRGVARNAPALETGFKRILQEQDEIENSAKDGNYRHAKEKELFLKNNTGPEFLAAAGEYIKAVDRYDGCMVTARDFKELSDARKGLLAQRKKVDQYANWGNSWWNTEKEAKVLLGLADSYRKISDEKQKAHNEKGEKITKALNDAGPAKIQEVARNIIANELKNDADIKYLPADVRNRLVEVLQSNRSPENLKAVQRIYAVRTLDPEFEKEDRKNRDKLIAALQNDPEMAKARKNWSKMTGPQKFEVMKKIVMHHAAVYGSEKAAGVPDLKVESFNDPPVRRNGQSEMTGGLYQPATGKLRININSKSGAIEQFRPGGRFCRPRSRAPLSKRVEKTGRQRQIAARQPTFQSGEILQHEYFAKLLCDASRLETGLRESAEGSALADFRFNCAASSYWTVARDTSD